jgi:hypothetical protein
MELTTNRYFSRRFLIGGILILGGVLLFLMNIGIIARFPIWKFFPLLIIAGGISRLVVPYERAQGFWFLILGIWLQVSMLRLGGLTFGETWPAVLVAFGIFLIWQAAERDARRRRAEETQSVITPQSPEDRKEHTQ